MPATQQIVIIHLSDIHFSEKQRDRFAPGHAVGEGNLPREGFPTLLEKLSEDLRELDPGCPVIICITGDITQEASVREFEKAKEFINGLAETPVFGLKRGLSNIFTVPGNHDVTYTLASVGERWQNWTNFHNEVFNTAFARHRPLDCARVHDRIDDLGALILCLNSAAFVEKDTPEENRGLISHNQLTQIAELLEEIPRERRDAAIRIALIHHHPVLIPGLTEPGRGYEAVENSRYLLRELRKFGFHLILHGHKHEPYHFSEDSYSAFNESNQPPITIVAGGSASSKALPEGGYNTYNQISVKWIPDARQGRILIHTRGLQIRDSIGEMLPSRWRWKELSTDERAIFVGPRAPAPKKPFPRRFEAATDEPAEAARIDQYRYLRGNIPVCEVMPSLRPGQHYEARLWIERHRPDIQDPERDLPIDVTWSAGDKFPVITVNREDDPLFCARLNYYQPMLVQARLRFPQDGLQPESATYAYVYARRPAAYS